MLFVFGFYSSLLLITFSQGIIYTLLLLKKAISNENRSNYWLSLFVFLCSLYVAPWMLGFAGWYDTQPYRDILFYLPLQHLFLIGPVIFFYTQSLLNPEFRFTRKDAIHLLPGIAYLIYILGIGCYDLLVFKGYYFYADGMDKDFDDWYQKLGFVSMLSYYIVSLRYYNRYRKLMYQVVSYADSVLFEWIRTYLVAFLVMLILPVIFNIICYFFPELQSYEGSWWFFLCFSLVMYYIAVSGYANPVSTTIGFRMSAFDRQPLLLIHANHDDDIVEESVIDIEHEIYTSEPSPEIEAWKIKIDALIQSDKLYQNPELTLTDLSKKLQTNASVLSKAINQGFQMNFNDFINNYRIEAVKTMFEIGEHKKTTLLGIAFDCGFNSKATFNRAFKKNTGFSPKEYLEKS